MARPGRSWGSQDIQSNPATDPNGFDSTLIGIAYPGLDGRRERDHLGVREGLPNMRVSAVDLGYTATTSTPTLVARFAVRRCARASQRTWRERCTV